MKDDDILDIAISYDGTWQKRGFSSHNGIGIITDLLTGLVVDFEVLSNFCLRCTAAEAKYKEKPEEYEAWKANQKD